MARRRIAGVLMWTPSGGVGSVLVVVIQPDNGRPSQRQRSRLQQPTEWVVEPGTAAELGAE
jgi:hypothetical protein